MLGTDKVTLKGNKGVGVSEIEAKKHNLWIGISVSNKQFTPENIESLIQFCLKYTKEKVLIWIPGRMQAINYYYFRELGRAEALRRGFEDEDKCRETVQGLLQNLSKQEADKVVIANYDEVCTARHIRQREFLYRAFSQQGEFYKAVIQVVEELILARGRSVTLKRSESLALYVLQELPLFLDGVQKNDEETVYTVVPYPGFGKIDDLVMEVREGNRFPELTKQLQLRNQVGILDVGF